MKNHKKFKTVLNFLLAVYFINCVSNFRFVLSKRNGPYFLLSGILAIPITADISKSSDVQRMVDTVVSKWGAIHIACNNAGINMNSASEDTSLEEWDRTFNVNLRGTFMCCQVCSSPTKRTCVTAQEVYCQHNVSSEKLLNV